MKKRSRRYHALREALQSHTIFSIDEASKIISDVAKDGKLKPKYDETVRVSIALGIKSRHTIRDTVVLPHVIRKDMKILVFARGDEAEEAKKAGATYVGDQDLIDKIQNENWYDFDIAISTPEMMAKVGRLGALLGPRGLMPNPKVGTVAAKVAPTVIDFKKGKSEFRADRQGNVGLAIGKSSFNAQHIAENVLVLIAEIRKQRPSDLKGEYIRKVVLSLDHGPGLPVNYQNLAIKKA